MSEQKYRWPTKLRKFGITDPLLMMLVAKYEDEIPWQSFVKDEKSLRSYVGEIMLPRLLERIQFPPRRGVKHYFISARDVDLKAALTTDPDVGQTEIDVVRLIHEEDGVEEATKALLELINAQKIAAFKSWEDVIGKKPLSNPAMGVLLLRPLFEMSGPRSRRPVMPPSMDIIDWLHRRLLTGRLSPAQNIARVFCLKLASGSQKLPRDGWQYIPADSSRTLELTAACRGSGWCVASHYWASEYLHHSSFYILRSENKPVVALRVNAGGAIVECQGRNNYSPADWFLEIHMFCKTQNMQLNDRQSEMKHALKGLGNLQKQTESWWVQRVTYWPFALKLASVAMADRLKNIVTLNISYYLGFPSFQNLATQLGMEISSQEWLQIVEIEPRRYLVCPEDLRVTPAMQAACVRGWIELFINGEATLNDLKCLQDFVKKHPDFIEALRENYPDQLKQLIRQKASTYHERRNRLNLEDIMPEQADETFHVAVERGVNRLLNNETDDFSESVFTDVLRERNDFNDVRVAAWQAALQAHPPIWFALPDDLRGSQGFELDTGDVTRVNLDIWCEKVRAKPWLLTQKSGVPKSVRFHQAILDSYRKGWHFYLEKCPWRIWVKSGQFRRVYMSYALLTDAETINVLKNGWLRHEQEVNFAWGKASDRMQTLPALQVSLLRAVCTRRNIQNNSEALSACAAIRRRRHFSNDESSVAPHACEIRNRLLDAGFL